MAKHFAMVLIMTAFASVAIRLFITNANATAHTVGLQG